jgi:hypothetical protein
VVQNRDTLTVRRWGTGDFAAALLRDGELVAGIGALRICHLEPRLRLDEDPRADEVRLYHLPSLLDDPETTLVWLHLSDPHLEQKIAGMSELRTARVVVAIAGSDPTERQRLNHRVAQIRMAVMSAQYEDVDARFANQEDWLEYLRRLPRVRPEDLWIRFTLGGASTVVREGEYAFQYPWHLFVHSVHRPGVPGELSQLAVAREDPALDKDVIVSSTKAIAARDLEIR